MEAGQAGDVGQVLAEARIGGCLGSSWCRGGARGSSAVEHVEDGQGASRHGDVTHGRAMVRRDGRRTGYAPAMDLAALLTPDALIALVTLTVLEIVLGIDNVIFISILVQRLPAHQRDNARRIGLGLAMGMRILLLLTISWIIGLTAPLFTIAGKDFSTRDVILIVGGLFLLWKATTEIHESLEGEEAHHADGGKVASFRGVLIQIVLLDIVFSLDSVLTAVGLVDEVAIMIAAVVIAVGVMLVASGPLSRFVHDHPSVKMLALAFLLLIGVTLVLDGFGFHVDKAYIYAAMGFSVFVEALNLRRSAKRKAVELRPTFVKDSADAPTAPPAEAH
jgi:predicted tellurium resistance membrane protein TerC